MSERVVHVELTEAEIELLLDGLDSHEYWELSERDQRSSGYSTIGRGESKEVDGVRRLIAKLERYASAGRDSDRLGSRPAS